MISYSTKLQAVADRLHAALGERGCRPKLDRLDIDAGDRWRESIAWWLAACDTAVVLLCSDALASPWVRYELAVLANRELAAKDLRLILVPIGENVDFDKVVEDPAFKPCRLGELEAPLRFSHRDLTDDEVDAIADAVAEEPVALSGPIVWFIAQARDAVRSVGHAGLSHARSFLPADETSTTWLDDEPRSASSEEEHQLRWRFARDFCSAGWQLRAEDGELRRLDERPLIGALEALADDPTFEVGDAMRLVRVRQQAVVDPLAVRVLHDCQHSPGRVAVIGGVHFERVRLTSEVMRWTINGTLKPYVRGDCSMFTGATPEEVAEGVWSWLEENLKADGEDIEDYLADCAEDGRHVFIVLREAHGIRAALPFIAERVRPASILLLASRSKPPREWSAELGAPIAGPDLIGEPWEDHIDLEDAVLALTDTTGRLYRAIERAKRAAS
ncbi:MAG: toll/interleukin-1 receptor domain-containing protein [Acidimicrobiia bacterium]